MTLDELTIKHSSDKSTLYHGYSLIYEKVFGHLRDEPFVGLEIGTQFNLGLNALSEWSHKAEWYGVDITPTPTENQHIHLFQGNQSDPAFWGSFMPGLKFNLVIEDASHLVSDQSICFECVWPRVVAGGLFIFEDLWVWPDPLWKQEKEAVNFQTKLIWHLHRSGRQYHGRPGGKSDPLSEMDTSIEWIHHYPGLMIIKKKA